MHHPTIATACPGQNQPPGRTGQPRPVGHTRPAARRLLWLQGFTLAWMLLECGIALAAAALARSPVLLAFASDSLVELLSAVVVLLPLLPHASRLRLSPQRAARIAGLLLFVLAAVVALAAVLGLLLHRPPQSTRLGLAITLAALLVMPALAALKRREARRTGNAALAADAVQSATCAYLAAITLTGLAASLLLHAPWFDSAAALIAVPLLIREGHAALRGDPCACGS